jgi:hypothetical protein
MHTNDHHSAYLARAVAALTPEGRRRVDELLEQLAEVVGGHEQVLRFARAREAEADLGSTDVAGGPEPGNMLTEQELDVLIAGFTTIRDQESLDDVGDWANAVLALLEDERAQSRRRSEG